VSSAADSRPGFDHEVPVRVRYPETDRMGVVYHGNYLVWFELGRTELMRDLGCAYSELEDRRGLSFPVIEAHVRYHRSARYDERLTVRTRLQSVGRARVRFEYQVIRDGEETPLATGFTEHASVGADGRPTRLPDEVRRRLTDRAESTTETGPTDRR
jgi:acyl-CoA thioester hydrolase